jgi:hypothetical protein
VINQTCDGALLGQQILAGMVLLQHCECTRGRWSWGVHGTAAALFQLCMCTRCCWCSKHNSTMHAMMQGTEGDMTPCLCTQCSARREAPNCSSQPQLTAANKRKDKLKQNRATGAWGSNPVLTPQHSS